MKNKIKKNDFTKLKVSEMKCIYGGDDRKKIVIEIDGQIFIIYV